MTKEENNQGVATAQLKFRLQSDWKAVTGWDVKRALHEEIPNNLIQKTMKNTAIKCDYI